MRAVRIFADFAKEEAWLNQMADRGHLLAKPGPLYSFASVTPGSTTIRIDYRNAMTAGDFEDYRSLFADAGWSHLAGSRSSGTQYFASSATIPNADIFSDDWSKAQRYRRAIGVGSGVLLPLLVVVFVLLTQGSLAFDTFLAPRDWYLTPGLWQMHGWEFTRAFLFETPFVVLRNIGPVLLLAACLLLLARITYQGPLYRKALVRSTA